MDIGTARAVNRLYWEGFELRGEGEDKRGTYVEYVKRFKTGILGSDALYKLRVYDGVCYGIFSYDGKENVKFVTKKGFVDASETAVEGCAILRQQIDEATQRIMEKMVV